MLMIVVWEARCISSKLPSGGFTLHTIWYRVPVPASVSFSLSISLPIIERTSLMVPTLNRSSVASSGRGHPPSIYMPPLHAGNDPHELQMEDVVKPRECTLPCESAKLAKQQWENSVGRNGCDWEQKDCDQAMQFYFCMMIAMRQ